MKLVAKRLFVPCVVPFVFLAGASALVSVSAEQKSAESSKCPVMKVTCPSEISSNNPLNITANLRGGDPNVTPTYNWTVSNGTIEAGQGTSNIQVNTTGLTPDSTITATVEAGGFDRDCSTTDSCTSIIVKKAEARKVDEYGALKPKDEAAKLDNFVVELNLEPKSQAYIISYNSRTGRPGDAQKTADKVKAYLIRKRGVDATRVVTVTGASREQTTVELWIVPAGAPLPKPTIRRQ